MKLKLFLSTITGVFCLVASGDAKDKYGNYAELSRSEREGKDFVVTTLDRNAPVAVLAIHGGKIEPGTGTLARAVARRDLSYYIFESKKNVSNVSHDEMHLTSTHFDDPRALALVNHSKYCVSLHGFVERSREHYNEHKICVGGANLELREHVAEALRKAYPFDIELLCERLRGIEPLNIVNRCQQQGVQLEMSIPVLNDVLSNPRFATGLANTIRRAIFAEH